MRRREVAFGIGIGLGILAFILVGGSGTSHPIGKFVQDTLFDLWFVGAALLTAAIALHVRGQWQIVERGLGAVAVAWVSFIVGYYGLLFLLLLYQATFGGGFGY
jgi:hypothetical protein